MAALGTTLSYGLTLPEDPALGFARACGICHVVIRKSKISGELLCG
jgi:hypothetical protein